MTHLREAVRTEAHVLESAVGASLPRTHHQPRNRCTTLRAAGGGDDWISILLQCADDEGVPFDDERLATMLTVAVLVGGSETTRHVIANLFR
jgi:cytochrome P450